MSPAVRRFYNIRSATGRAKPSVMKRAYGLGAPMQKIKYKGRAKTATKTKTMTKSKLYLKVKHDGPISESRFTWPQRQSSFKLGKFKKLLAPQYYIQNGTARVTAGVGVQGFLSNGGPGIWTPTDITAIMGLASNVAPASTNPKTQKVYFKSCINELMLTNQTNDPVHCQIYECVARRDTANAGYWNPGIAWLTGDIDQGTGGICAMVGSNPFQSAAFTEFWLVEKVIDVNLHSGGHHIHRSTSKINHVFNDEVIQSLAASNACVGKLTRFSLVVIHGYPANDSDTQTQISTNACAIDMVWRKQFEFEVLERSTTQFTAINNLPTAFTVASSIINDLTAAAAGSIIA